MILTVFNKHPCLEVLVKLNRSTNMSLLFLKAGLRLKWFESFEYLTSMKAKKLSIQSIDECLITFQMKQHTLQVHLDLIIYQQISISLLELLKSVQVLSIVSFCWMKVLYYHNLKV